METSFTYFYLSVHFVFFPNFILESSALKILVESFVCLDFFFTHDILILWFHTIYRLIQSITELLALLFVFEIPSAFYSLYII